MPCVCSLQEYHGYYLHDSEHETSRYLDLRVEKESVVPSLPRASQPRHRVKTWRKERRYVVLRSLWTVGYSFKDALQQYGISICLVNLQALYFAWWNCIIQQSSEYLLRPKATDYNLKDTWWQKLNYIVWHPVPGMDGGARLNLQGLKTWFW